MVSLIKLESHCKEKQLAFKQPYFLCIQITYILPFKVVSLHFSYNMLYAIYGRGMKLLSRVINELSFLKEWVA